jgi:type IV pilus assembly protein PilA
MQAGPPYPYAQPVPPAKKSSTWIIVLIVVVVGGLVMLPVLAALSIYGVRRYIASAKTSEAKNTIGAIARGAKQAFEREAAEGGGHKLCASAISVPSVIPSGKKYQPDLRAGADFDTGDARTGWKCLKFSMTQPFYYKYSYTKGSSPITSSHGGSPTVAGGESFEAAAEGDLDGDHSPSAFALSGRTDASNELLLATQVYVFDEFE